MFRYVAGGAFLFFLGVACSAMLFFGGGAAALQSPADLQPAHSANPIALVNGQPIGRALLEIRLDQRFNEWGQDARGDDEGAVEVRQQIVDDLILMELLVQQALSQGMDKHPEVIAGAELSYKTLLAQRLVREMADQTEVLDAEISKRYQELPEEPAYKISHILLEDEAAALEVIAALDRGENFGQIADERSVDSNAGKGGSLGWLTSNRMLYPVVDAVSEMKPGQYSRVPIETAVGWHVVQLEGTKTMPGMSLEEAEEWLRDEIINEKVKMQFADLRKNAKIELLQSD